MNFLFHFVVLKKNICMSIKNQLYLVLLTISMFLGFTNPIFGNKANKVSLIYKDNTQKKGLLSTFTGVDDKVKFRTDEKAKVEKIKVSLLKYIIFENEDDKY